MLPEERDKGSINLQTIGMFLRELGGGFFLLACVVLAGLEQVLLNKSMMYLTQWSSDYNHDDPQMANILWYTLLNVIRAMTGSSKVAMLAYAAYRLSQRLHGRMVFALRHARVEQFLSRVSSGRIINRFSNDLNHIDGNCFTDTDYVIYMTASVVTTLLMYCEAIGYRSLAFVIVMVPVLLYLQRTYMSVKREAIRLEAVAKSPTLSILSDSLKGLPHIRSSGL